MRVNVIPVVVSALGIISKGLERRLEDLEIRGRTETIQTTALLKLARILKKRLAVSQSSVKTGEKMHKEKKNNSQQKKRTCWIVDYAISADHRVKLKENKKRDTYQDLTRKLKKLWNIKVTVIPIVTDVLGTVTKGLVQALGVLEIKERMETIQTTDQPKYRKDSWKPEETCCHSDSREKPLANAGVKNSQKSIIIMKKK